VEGTAPQGVAATSVQMARLQLECSAVGSGLWQTALMANRKKRIPKIGDRVAMPEENGAFLIYMVDSYLGTAELKLIGHDFALSSVPWNTMTFLDEDDAGQAAQGPLTARK
jgi:hypothetical protein